MLVESIPLGKLFSAVAADVRLLPSMRSHVPLPKVTERKPHSAFLARVPLHAAVDYQMPGEGSTQPETSPAHRTTIPLLHGVDRLVLQQTFPRPETLPTGFALERSLAGVHAKVEAETPGVDERPSAHAADVVLARGVQSQVVV